MGSIRPTKLFECHGARSLEYTPSGLFVSSRTNVTFVSHTEHAEDSQTRVFRFNVHSSSIISVARPLSDLVAYQSPKLFVCAYSVRQNKDVIKVPWERELHSLCIFANDKDEPRILFSDSDGTWLTQAGSVPQKVNDVSFDHMFELDLTVYASSGNTVYRLDRLYGQHVVFEAPSLISKFQMRSHSEILWTADSPHNASNVCIYLSQLLGTECGSYTDLIQHTHYSKSSTAKAVSSVESRLFYVENGFVMEDTIMNHVHSITTVHSLASSDSICRISSVEKCLYFADSTGIWRQSLDLPVSTPQLQRRINVRQFEIDSSGYMYYTKKGIRGSLFRAICQEAEKTIASQQGLLQSFSPSDSYVFACCSSGRRQATQLHRWDLYDTSVGSINLDLPSVSTDKCIHMCVDEDQHIVYVAAPDEIHTFSFDLNSLQTISFECGVHRIVHRMIAANKLLLVCSQNGISNASLTKSILSGTDANFKEVQVIGNSMFMHIGSNIYKGVWIPRAQHSQHDHAQCLVLSDVSPMSVDISWSGDFETVGIQLKKKTERQFKLVRESVTSPYSLQGLQEGTSYDIRLVCLGMDYRLDYGLETSFTTPAATKNNCRALHQKLRKKNRSGQSVFDLTVDSESLAIVKQTIRDMCNTGDRVRMRFRAQDRILDAELHYIRNGEKFRLQEGSHNALLAFEQSRGSAQKVRLQSHDKRSESSIGYDESSNRIIVGQNSYGIGDTFFMHGRRVTVAQGSIVLMFANVVPDSFPYASSVTSLGSMGGISTGTAILKSLYRVADRVTSDQTSASSSSYVKDSGETLEFSRVSHLANETLDYGTFKISVLSTLSDASQILTDSVTCTPLGTTLVQNTIQSSEDVTNVISVTSDGISASSESFAIYFGDERQFRIKYTDSDVSLLNIQYLKDGSYVTRAEFTST